ncbi:MAG: sigma-54 dependent transcriptional regulator [Gemmatimonadaceae bacterium]
MDFGINNLIGQSSALRGAVELARKVAQTRLTTVLIVGETGTGKELFARGIHYAGLTHGEPFVAVNCAAIPENLLESELFGHERGAFTDARSQKRGLLELAGAGTLFLDEVGELPQKLQPKLLRALEDRRIRRVGGHEEIRVNCRIIAATNASLPDAVARLEFREDLYYRLNVFRITLPPLREREDDIIRLATTFLSTIAEDQGLPAKSLKPDAVAALRKHSWPGNVRELKNVIERAAILCETNAIGAEHLMVQHRSSHPVSSRMTALGGEIHIPPGGKSLDSIEREAIALTLQITNGNRSATSRVLGISRPTLARKMRDYGFLGARAAVA